MIQAQIQLYLTKEGRTVFTDWLRFFGRVAKQFDGFVNIQLLSIEKSASSSMVVIFDKKNSIDAFLESKVFQQLMKHMEVHSMHPYRVIVYRSKNMYRYRSQTKKSAVNEHLAQPQIQKPSPQEAEKAKQDAKAPTKDSPLEISEDEQGQINVVGLASFMQARKIQRAN